MKQYKLKNTPVEAIRWTGDNGLDLQKFTGGTVVFEAISDPASMFMGAGTVAKIRYRGGIVYIFPWWYAVKIGGKFIGCPPEDFVQQFVEV